VIDNAINEMVSDEVSSRPCHSSFIVT